MSNESKLQTYHSSTDASEGRLRSRDKTLAALLEQAFKIKEEVAAGLQSTRGSVQVEALSRKLLENHILTITRIVRQLSTDIQALETQIVQRDSVTSGTTSAVQRLDQKNTAGIGDLRVRVARCDASIVKLSTDASSGQQRMIRLQQDVEELRSAVNEKLKELEAKLHRELRRLEASLTELSQVQRNSACDLQSQVKLLEDKMTAELRKAAEQTHLTRNRTEQQLSSIAQTHTESSQQLRSLLQGRTSEAERRLSDRLCALEVRLGRCEAQRDQADRGQSDRLKRSESRLTSVEKSFQRELQLLKQEYQRGFLSVRDAIESLRQIGDIKSRLDKELLQNSIRHLCSKVAELDDM